MRRLGVLLAMVLVLVVGCSSDPPAEDVARAEVIKTDPIFEVDTGLEESLGLHVVHGTGAVESDIMEVGRSWLMDGADPVAMTELMLAAAIDAEWRHLKVECTRAGTVRLKGAKNFDDEVDFRAALSVSSRPRRSAGGSEPHLHLTVFVRRPSLDRVSGLVASDAPVVEDRSCLDDPAAAPPPGLVTTTTLHFD